MKQPWFSIVEVVEQRGRSMVDIANEVAREKRVQLSELRSNRRAHKTCAARREAFLRIKAERPDLTSNQVAIFFNREGSTVRHIWTRAAA